MRWLLVVLVIWISVAIWAALDAQVPIVNSGEHNHEGSGAHRHSHEQNLQGFDELTESVFLRKLNRFEAELEALEERVTALEEQ